MLDFIKLYGIFGLSDLNEVCFTIKFYISKESTLSISIKLLFKEIKQSIKVRSLIEIVLFAPDSILD